MLRPLREWSARIAGIAVPYARLVTLRGLDALYILQLERYKPDRYRLWLAGHRAALVPGREVAVQCLTVAVASGMVNAGYDWHGPILCWILTGFLLLRRFRSLQVSQRLQWTARAIRVGSTALGIAVAMMSVVLVLAWTMYATAIGTELHLVNRLKQEHPEQEIHFLSPVVCMCATMYRIDLAHLCWSLENLVAGRPVNVIEVAEETARWSLVALHRMLEVK